MKSLEKRKLKPIDIKKPWAIYPYYEYGDTVRTVEGRVKLLTIINKLIAISLGSLKLPPSIKVRVPERRVEREVEVPTVERTSVRSVLDKVIGPCIKPEC